MRKSLIYTSLFLVISGCYSKQNENITKKEKDIYKKIENSVEYIDPVNSLFSDGFEVCNEIWIYNYYNPERATYSKGKNKLKEFIIKNYDKRSYSDSGYLNIHFVINCKGETGRYKVYENNLDLEPYRFNNDLKDQLLELTRKLRPWNPNIIRGERVDSYIYISYKIKNGEIIEILP